MLLFFYLCFSRVKCSVTPPDVIKITHIFKTHQQKVIMAVDEEDYQRIHVRSKCLFDDAVWAFSRPTFNASKLLKVTFIGEGAVDGGPRREFFNLLMKDAFHSSGLFSGWPSM